MAISCVLISVLAIIFFAQIIPSNGQSCYLQHCLNCHNTAVVGSRTPCTYGNYIQPDWFLALNIIQGPAVSNNEPFRCIKYNSTSLVSTSLPHILRGCVLGDDNAAINMCTMLSRSQGNGRFGVCSYCRGNNCNSAVSKRPLLSLLVVAVLTKLFAAVI